jgi:hypothetical protein
MINSNKWAQSKNPLARGEAALVLGFAAALLAIY